MTEEGKNDNYIICSKCRSKYINDEEHIANDFGYTRLEERYKTCVRCRVRSKLNNKTFLENILRKIKNIMKPIKKKRKNEINNIDRTIKNIT